MARSLSDHGMEIVRSFADVPQEDPEKVNRDLTRAALRSATDEKVDPTVPTPWEQRRAEVQRAEEVALMEQVEDTGTLTEAQSDAATRAFDQMSGGNDA